MVEILSSTPQRDRVLNFARYQLFGVPELWIIDPVADQLEVYRLVAAAYGEPAIFGARDRVRPLLPVGLEVDCAELFAD